MKPGKLYIKLFLSFLLFLIITEFAIFGFFILFFGQEYRDNFNRGNDSKLILAKKLIEDNLTPDSTPHPADNQAVKQFMDSISEAFHVKIWLTHSNNSVLYKTFKSEIPDELVKKIIAFNRDHKSRFHSRFKKNHKIYGNQPIKVNNKEIAKLHFLFIKPPPTPHKIKFALGLIFIGLIIAIIIIPVSRQISSPINKLTFSARIIENGDLSHRTKITTRDEIGELGKAFNSMAEKLEKMIKSGKELTAQVSHELRSPLARIQLAAELIKNKLKKEENIETTQHLFDIEEDVEELDQLIGRILELSKLDLKEPAPYAEIFSPATLLETITAKYKPAFKIKGIRLSMCLSSKSNIEGNLEAFTVALSNIVDNACKFSPENGKINISTRLENRTLVISITNSFTKLLSDELTRIFEPFYRISASEKNKGGLGLAITRKIVEKHQGNIVATNARDGLKIQLSLPASHTS